MLRLRDGNRERADQRLRPPRDEQRQRSGQRGEEQSLGDDQPHEPSGLRAERRANPHLALALDPAREQKVGDVETRQQQHESDDPHHHGGDRAEHAQLGVPLGEQPELRAARAMRVRPLAGHRRGRRVEAPLRFRDRYAWRELPHHEQPARVACLQACRVPVERQRLEREPDIGRVDARGSVERFGDDAGYRHVHVVQAQGEAGERTGLQLLPPEPFPDRRRRRAGRNRRHMQAAGDRGRLDHGEVRGGDEQDPGRLGRAVVAPRHRRARLGRHRDGAAGRLGETLELRQRSVPAFLASRGRDDPAGPGRVAGV